MASPVLGIDLGTTNSVVAILDGEAPHVLKAADDSRLTPSVVSFHPSGSVLVGAAGRERRLLDAGNTIFSVKRLIGRPFRSPEVRKAADRLPFTLREGASGGVTVQARGEIYSLPEISALVLRQVRSLAEAELGQRCLNGVITVPANFNELQRTATRDAGRIAGLNVLRILNEPTAAALAYGYGARTRERIAVYDLGGGTFDVSLLDLSGDVIEVVATAGDSYLGGDDIDTAVADLMAKAFLRRHNVDLSSDQQAYERLRMAAEWLKCQLSSAPRATCRVEEVAYGKHGKAMDLEFTLLREELDRITFPIVGRTFDICEEALRIAGLRPAQLDNVILVGGQTASPLVRQMVSDYFGRAPLASVDPSEVVAQGAAILGHTLAGGAFRRRSPRSTRPPASPAEALAVDSTDAGFDDEPTRVAHSDDEEPTGVLSRSRPLSAHESLGPNKSTLMGVGSRAPSVAPPAPVSSPERTPAPDVTLPPAVMRPKHPTLPSDPRQTVPGRPKNVRSSKPSVGSPSPAPIGRVTLRSSAPPPAPESSQRSSTPADSSLARASGSEQLRAPRVPAEVGPPGSGGELPPPLFGSAEVGTPRPAPPSGAPDEHAPEVEAGASALEVEAGSARDERPTMPARTHPRTPASTSVPPPPAERGVPLLLDVTPHTLAVETTGGYCEQIIARNAPIPTEQTRRFSTSQDNQSVVRVRVCQGEQRRVEANQELGAVELMGLRRGVRGEVKIDVTFMVDVNGTLDVRARDESTGKAQEIRIDLVGALSDDDIEHMRKRQAELGWG